MKVLPFLILLTLPSLFCFAEEGFASWYGGKFQGRQTASGEIFDTNLYTAAHKTLPFGTMVRVTNTENGKTVDVRINDRGPFVEGRIIDLSRIAAAAIGISGIGRVSVDIIPKGATGTAASSDTQATSVPGKAVNSAETLDHYTILLQTAAFRDPDNAMYQARDLSRAGLPVLIEVAQNGVYRVVVPAISDSEAESLIKRMVSRGFASPLKRTNFDRKLLKKPEEIRAG